MNLKGALVTMAAAMAVAAAGCQTQGISTSPVTEGDDIVGVVTGPSGPEAGVWVIAETRDLPTPYTKIVVTDDQGRYAIPDLPKANYNVWVRGYGLVDGQKNRATPGSTLNLLTGREASPKEAAEIYPGMYWFSLLKVPAANEFPLGPVQSQQQWLNTIKSGACQSCHGLGTPGMRKVPELFMKMGGGKSHEAWRHRLRSGSAQALMARDISRLDGERAIANFADWTDRIAKGELPYDKPARPQGLERNLVITMWDYLRPEFYLHDVVSTDRRNPRVNANGPVYGSPEDSTDIVPVVDPRAHRAIELPHPVRDPATPSVKGAPYGVSAYWGDKPYWEGRTLNHNPMMDERARTWFTSRISPDANPDWCKAGSDHPSAKAYPLNGGANRHLSYYDPQSKSWTLIRTCFPTHHLNFSKDNVLWTSPGVVGPGVIGWFDAKSVREDERREKQPGLDAVHPRHQRGWKARRVRGARPAARPEEGQAGDAQPLLGGDQSRRRHGVGDGARLSGLADPRGAGSGSDQHRAHRGVRAAAAGLRAARRRHRRERRVLGRALERASRPVRPAQVQGDERADRDRQALPGRLDAAPVPRAAAARREGPGQRRDELLRLGRLVRRPGIGKERSHRHGQRLRLHPSVRRRQVRHAAAALSVGPVPEERRRAHRRRGRGMEGPRRSGPLRARAPTSTSKAARRTTRRRSSCSSGRIRWRGRRPAA